jgi:hypothetical protein
MKKRAFSFKLIARWLLAAALLARWLLAVALLYGAYWFANRALSYDGFFAASYFLAFAVQLISSVILISPELAHCVGGIISKPFASLFLPDEKFSRPPLSYILARKYAHDKRYQDAVQEYLQIIKHYPDEREPYEEIIRIANLVGDTKTAAKFKHKLDKKKRLRRATRKRNPIT